MEIVTKRDLEEIEYYGGKHVNKEAHDKLVTIYKKLKHICTLLNSKGFIADIRMDPRKQAGTGKFVFQNYQWAKVYPSEYYHLAKDKFAYIIGFSGTLHFHMMGIKDYQNIDYSKSASRDIWTEIPLENITYERIVEEFIVFDKINRMNFLKLGSDLKIDGFSKIIEEMRPNKDVVNLLKYKKQIILQGPPGTGKTMLAKEIAEDLLELSGEMIEKIPATVNENTIKSLIKNHVRFKSVTGYSDYEVVKIERDTFVVKTHKTGNEYPAKINKIINYYEDQKWSKSGSKKNGNDSYEAALAKYLYDTLDVVPEIETLKNTERLRVLQFHPSYTYEDFVRGIASETKGDSVVYKARNRTLVELANKAILDSAHNYVLILDEINRANLSAVLGELIYAFEYRDKEVDSMYEVNGSYKISLPSNLYIIGTMNTADRSVGHIDYAIRRRFAFVDVLPKDLTNDPEIKFHSQLFREISSLFVKNFDEYLTDKDVSLKRADTLSAEFRPEDVWLGHSYFIQKKKKGDGGNEILDPENFSIRLDYEIKPILREYVKDGILIGKIGGIEVLDYINGL